MFHNRLDALPAAPDSLTNWHNVNLNSSQGVYVDDIDIISKPSNGTSNQSPTTSWSDHELFQT